MTAPGWTVGRDVVVEMVRLAALEVPGVVRVGRGGPGWRAFLAGPPVGVRMTTDGVHVKVRVIARPGVALRPLAEQVGAAVRAAVERLLALELADVTVVVDGVGG